MRHLNFVVLFFLSLFLFPIKCDAQSSVPLNEQIDTLIHDVSELCEVDESLVRETYQLAGGTALYLDRNPDIYLDETIHSAKAPMYLIGADTRYREIPKEEYSDISRTMSYYLPDAMYSVISDLKVLMDERLAFDRGDQQLYFNSLVDDVRKRLVYYEALLLYIGVDESKVNKLQSAYEFTITEKLASETVAVQTGDTVVLKNEYSDIFSSVGLDSLQEQGYLAKLLANDKILTESEDMESLRDIFILPYTPNYPSRLNMMIASACLVGRVRYVWGGGHSGASYIDGINPIWIKFNDAYPEEHINSCIKPGGTWCPLHGSISDEYHGGMVYSLDEYVESRAEAFDSSELLHDKYRDMLSSVNYSNGINAHTLDGLDCSGFASWLYNQVTDKYSINSTARDFTKQSGVVSLEFGDKLLPGDLFAWTRHIIVIVGQVSEGSKAYVTVESTPSILRYGVAYYSGASDSDIALGMQIAREANELIGGISIEPHCYNMNNVGYYSTYSEFEEITVVEGEEVLEEYDHKEENEDGSITYYIAVEGSETQEQYIEVGRLDVEFEPSVEDYTAIDTLQEVLRHLTISYVEGYSTYTGDLFDKSVIGERRGY